MVTGYGLHGGGDVVQLRPPLATGGHAGDGSQEVRFSVGKELATRAKVTRGCKGAARGVALDGGVVLLRGDDSEVVLELRMFES